MTTHSPTRRNPVLAICGGGNGGHAAAVVASQSFEGDVHWLVRTDETARRIRSSLTDTGLRSTGVVVGTADRVSIVSADPAEVIPTADVVLIVAPAFAHAIILRQIAPHLKQEVLLGCLPSRGGFEFEVSAIVPGIDSAGGRRVFGLQTLPWATRIVDIGRTVNISALKAKVLMAALPCPDAPEIARQLSVILGPELVPTASFLDMTLGNPGQLLHPGLMYGHFKSWSGEYFDSDSVPRFYAGATDEMGSHLERMSKETIAVARALSRESNGAFALSGVLDIVEWLRLSYPDQTGDMSTVATCLRTGPLQHLPAPMVGTTRDRLYPDFGYRYLAEDVPYGLVITRAIAELAGVATPAIDEVILWAQTHADRDYLIDGALDREGTHDLPIPQNYGCTTLAELTRWYALAERHDAGLALATP